MSIISIKIKNYKSIDEITLNLANKKMLALIGINNVGKTNILEAINNINSNYYRYNHDDDMHFNTLKKFSSSEQGTNDFYFELKLKYAFKNESIEIIVKNKSENKDTLLERIVNEIIKKYDSILKSYFKNKYILENNFINFINNLKEIIKNPDDFKIKLDNNFPFYEKIPYTISDQKKLEMWINNFLEKNYVFSNKEIQFITKELIEFLNTFKNLKEILDNYNFKNKIFYISSSLESYELNFQIFQPIKISNESIKLIPKNNYTSALIYNNDNYNSDLDAISQLLQNNKDDLSEEKLEELNQILKEKFSMLILNDNLNINEKYLIYPKLLFKEGILSSILVLTKKFNENKEEFIEDILLISKGLRNKLILKLNLQYCKKHKDKEFILLIDEPDCSLHISAILELYHEFKYLVTTTKSKIIYTTHSPYLLGNIFENYSNILVVEKNEKNKTIINNYSSINIKELNDTSLGKMISITGIDYLIINALNNQFNKYVTVEGKTDYEFYTWYNERYNKNKKLYFISINGKDKKELIEILKKLNLNFISLYDNDYDIKKDDDEIKIIKYENIFKLPEIKDLETLLNIKKTAHLKRINANRIEELDSFYQKIMNNNEIPKRINKVFKKINEKLDF